MSAAAEQAAFDRFTITSGVGAYLGARNSGGAVLREPCFPPPPAWPPQARVRDAAIVVDYGGLLVDVNRLCALGYGTNGRTLKRGVQELVAPVAADGQDAGALVGIGGPVARLDCAETSGSRR